jgi:hypothetical protein
MQTKIRWFDPKKPEHVVEELVNGSPKAVKELYESLGKQVEILETLDSEEMVIGPNGVSIPKSKMTELIDRENKAKIEALHKQANFVLQEMEKEKNKNNPKPVIAATDKPTLPTIKFEVAVPEPDSYVYFEEAGIKFRFNKTKNCMEKQDWIKIENDEMDNYAIQSDRGNRITLLKASKIKLLKKEWVQVNNGK